MMEEQDLIDSFVASELLGVSRNNLRQFVFRKMITPKGKNKRRSLFNRSDIEALKLSRSRFIPSAE